MIVFELTMPNIGSWNGHWTGETKRYIVVRRDKDVKPEMLKEIVDSNFFYDFGDGWTACVSVSKMLSRDANKLLKKSSGFFGYDWMVDSICKKGRIEHD